MAADFRSNLDELARQLVETSAHCTSEEAAKFSLVAPFIEFLGWNPRDPQQVKPEHYLDFSEKYRNKADFALFSGNIPVIAIECKSVGNARNDDRGQLKAYFNAAKTVRVGALTDGVVWEFFADSDDPNIMDDKPFLVIDLRAVAQGKAIEPTYDALSALTRDRFDPEQIGAEASRRLLFQGFTRQIGTLFSNPSSEFCRLLMKQEGVKNVRDTRMPEYQILVRQALKAVLDAEILQRLNIPTAALQAAQSANVQEAIEQVAEAKTETTAAEMNAFFWAKARLAFLVKDETLFALTQQLAYKDYQTRFIVYLGAERKGRIFEFYEGKEKNRYVFGNDKVIETNDLRQLDATLLETFQLRAKELAKAP